MNLLLGRFMPYIAGGLLVLLLSTGLAWRIEASRLANRTDERDAARAQVTQLKAAVSGKDLTIAALQASAAAWEKLATPAQSMKDAADRLDMAAKELSARSSALTSAEVKDRDKPDCAALLALDLARACPAYADSVRQRAAADRLRRQTGERPGAGGAESR